METMARLERWSRHEAELGMLAVGWDGGIRFDDRERMLQALLAALLHSQRCAAQMQRAWEQVAGDQIAEVVEAAEGIDVPMGAVLYAAGLFLRAGYGAQDAAPAFGEDELIESLREVFTGGALEPVGG